MMLCTHDAHIVSWWNQGIASREKCSYHLLTRAYTSGYELVRNLAKILPCKVDFWILGEMGESRNVENKEISKTP